MLNPQSHTDPSLLQSVDLRAFFETLRVRWWVVPAVVATSIGFLQAQESDFRIEPARVIVSRSYEFSQPGTSLSAIGINLAISEFPEVPNQILKLGSNETRVEISRRLGVEVDVKVPAGWESPMTFLCDGSAEEECITVIDAYAQKAAEIKEDAIASGIQSSIGVLRSINASTPDPQTQSKITALSALSDNLAVDFRLVDQSVQSIGSTINQVRRPTFLMGAVAGLVLSLFILLQLTYSDKKVRSVRQLVRLTGISNYLGFAKKSANPVGDRRIALGIHQGRNLAHISRLRLVPLSAPILDTASVLRVVGLTGIPHTISKPLAEMSTAELSDMEPAEADVLLVKRNNDSRNDVVEAIAGMQRSDRQLIGVLLID